MWSGAGVEVCVHGCAYVCVDERVWALVHACAECGGGDVWLRDGWAVPAMRDLHCSFIRHDTMLSKF